VSTVVEVRMTLDEAARQLLERARLGPVDADRIRLLVSKAGQPHPLRHELFLAAARNFLDSKAITHRLVVARNTLNHPDTARQEQP
jgi:hypothetical protein